MKYSLDRASEYENGFYLTCTPYRLAKALAHYEFFKMTLDVPGDVIECGVYKGASLMRLVKYRDAFSNTMARRIYAFDMFSTFPGTATEKDRKTIETLFEKYGPDSISVGDLEQFLTDSGLRENVLLIPGNVEETLPIFLDEHPYVRISLMNVDLDFYEGTKTVLNHLYDRVTKGGIVMLDDYGSFHGANKAIEEFFAERQEIIRKLPFAGTPAYVVKS